MQQTRTFRVVKDEFMHLSFLPVWFLPGWLEGPDQEELRYVGLWNRFKDTAKPKHLKAFSQKFIGSGMIRLTEEACLKKTWKKMVIQSPSLK